MGVSLVRQFDLFHSLPLGVCVLSHEYIVLDWNRLLHEWTGVAAGNIVGTSLFETFPHLQENKYKSRFELALQGGPPHVFSPQLHPSFFPSLLPNGDMRIQRTTVSVNSYALEQSVLLICVQDVSSMMGQLQKIKSLQRRTLNEAEERKRALVELENANRRLVDYNEEKDRIMQIVTHDLRSPLSAIRGAAELIHSNPSDATTAAEFSDLIGNVADSLIALVNDFLDLAKAGAGKINLNLGRESMNYIAAHAVEFVERLAVKKEIQLSLLLPDSDIVLLADRSKMVQVLSNLLSNAIKFTPPQGSVSLTVQATEQGDVVVTVADTGIGMSDEQMSTLFDQFGKHQRQGTTGEKGTGLGMALVKSFVELHGGTISVQSTVGVGTTITVFIPTAMKGETVEETYKSENT